MGCGILGISRLKDTSIFGTILIYPLFLVEGCFFASLVLHNTCSLVERKKNAVHLLIFITTFFHVYVSMKKVIMSSLLFKIIVVPSKLSMICFKMLK